MDWLKRDGVVDAGLEDVIRVDFWFLPWLVDGLIKKRCLWFQFWWFDMIRVRVVAYTAHCVISSEFLRLCCCALAFHNKGFFRFRRFDMICVRVVAYTAQCVISSEFLRLCCYAFAFHKKIFFWWNNALFLLEFWICVVVHLDCYFCCTSYCINCRIIRREAARTFFSNGTMLGDLSFFLFVTHLNIKLVLWFLLLSNVSLYKMQ